MRLNGVYAFPGTFMGFTERVMGLRIGLIANGGGGGCGHLCHYPFTNLRPAKHGELEDLSMEQDPRSVAEHEALRRIRTPYGMARTFDLSTWGLGPVAENSYLQKLRQERKIKVARRRNRADLAHLYRLREGK